MCGKQGCLLCVLKTCLPGGGLRLVSSSPLEIFPFQWERDCIQLLFWPCCCDCESVSVGLSWVSRVAKWHLFFFFFFLPIPARGGEIALVHLSLLCQVSLCWMFLGYCTRVRMVSATAIHLPAKYYWASTVFWNNTKARAWWDAGMAALWHTLVFCGLPASWSSSFFCLLEADVLKALEWNTVFRSCIRLFQPLL